MTTAARARARSIGIVAACAVALVSLVISLRAISTQTDVAQREARRVAAEQTQQQQAACQFWRDLGQFDVAAVRSEIGRTLITDARLAADRLGCPP